MKKLFTLQNLRAAVWIIGGIIGASFFVFTVKADVANLNIQLCSHEKQINEAKVKSDSNEKRVLVLETQMKTILDYQKEMSSDIKKLLARR